MRSDNLFAYEAKNDSGVDKQVDENDGNMVVVRDNVSCPLLGGCVQANDMIASPKHNIEAHEKKKKNNKNTMGFKVLLWL